MSAIERSISVLVSGNSTKQPGQTEETADRAWVRTTSNFFA
nr:hypothetical protein [Xanthomonas translucens]